MITVELVIDLKSDSRKFDIDCRGKEPADKRDAECELRMLSMFVPQFIMSLLAMDDFDSSSRDEIGKLIKGLTGG